MLGVLFCVITGKIVAEIASPLLLVALSLLAVGLVSFLSPKIGLTIIIFSMIFSPKFEGIKLSEAHIHGAVILKVEDILLIIIFLAWFVRAAVVKRLPFLTHTRLNLPMFLYIFTCLTSTCLAYLRGELQGLRAFFYIVKYFEYYLLYFMTVNIVENRQDVMRYLRYGWITAILVTCYGYWSMTLGERVTVPFNEAFGSKDLGNEANTFGGYYLVIFAVLLAQFIHPSAGFSWWAWATLLFMMPPFLLTLSRSSYIGLTGALLFLLGLKTRKRLNLLFWVGLILIAFLFIPSVQKSVGDRIAFTFKGTGNLETMQLGSSTTLKLESSAMQRVTSWRDILLVKFPQHPLIGCGVTAVGLVDVQYPRVLGETGLFGLFFFLWLLYRLWKLSWSLYSEAAHPQDRALALGMLTALVGLLFHGFGANTFIIVRIMEPFWFLAALVARSHINLRNTQASIQRGYA